jgi:peptide-methionine (R)-S-oxide reductase
MSGTNFPLKFTRRHASIVATVILVATSLTINSAESLTTSNTKSGNSAQNLPTAVSRHATSRPDGPRHRTMCGMFSQDKDDKTETGATTENKKNEIKAQTWNPLRLAVMKLGLTELPMTSAFNYGKYDGEFTCGYCGNVLFDSTAKYDSGSGWPSFWRSANNDAILYKRELDGRLECCCQKCGSHLGHVFLDGPKPSSVPQDTLVASPQSDPRGRADTYLPRFCINGAAMNYQPRNEKDAI